MTFQVYVIFVWICDSFSRILKTAIMIYLNKKFGKRSNHAMLKDKCQAVGIIIITRINDTPPYPHHSVPAKVDRALR